MVSSRTGAFITTAPAVGVSNASAPYLVLASASGTAGIPFAGETVPLTYDSVTVYSILLRNTPIFGNTYGKTDDRTGSAKALFDTFYVPSALYGTTLTFATIGWGPSGPFVSNAEPVQISSTPQ